MRSVDSFFSGKSYDPRKLAAFGFTREKDCFTYTAPLEKKGFKIKVVIPENGAVSADVIDTETQEIYTLVKVNGAAGEFVGSIRGEFEKVLAEICEKCFSPDVFKNKFVQTVIRYIENKYAGRLEFLWEKFPQNAVVRRSDNAKWYAAFLNLPQSKLGLKGNEKIDIIDLRIDPSEINAVIDGQKYFPGYHMNKKHWITIRLDGSVPPEEIYERIDASYRLAAKK